MTGVDSVLRRIAIRLVAALSPLVGGMAWAQSYQITQSGASLGSFEVRLSQSVAGTVSDSTLDLPGIAELSDHLIADASGHARSYHLEGTAHGTPLTMDVALDDGDASFSIHQGGNERTLSVPLPGPVVVLDNSMLDGWQVVAAQLDAGSSRPQRYDVLVPQVARTGTVTFTAAGEEPATVGGEAVRAQRFDASLEVAGQTVGVTLWVDDAGRIVAFEQASAGLRYELETPASEAAAAERQAGVAAAQAALERHLQSQSGCVEAHDVSVESTGETLAGTLTVPAGGGRAPALLLLPGSGAVDRDGNAAPVITNGMYRQLAYALGCQGYAVLRIDKLGMGASSGDANAVTLHTYVQNAADWMALLRSREDIDPRRVGLMGHSEGGLVALASAVRGDVRPAAVLLLESPGLPMDRLLVDQIPRLAQLRGASDAEVAALRAQTEQAVQAIASSSGTAMELTGELASNPIAAGFAHAAGLLRSEFEADPVALAESITAPVLVVQGGKDVQVLPRNGEALAQAAPHATYLYLPDLEHDLYEATGAAIDHAVPEPGTRISTRLLDALHAFLAGSLLAAD